MCIRNAVSWQYFHYIVNGWLKRANTHKKSGWCCRQVKQIVMNNVRRQYLTTKTVHWYQVDMGRIFLHCYQEIFDLNHFFLHWQGEWFNAMFTKYDNRWPFQVRLVLRWFLIGFIKFDFHSLSPKLIWPHLLWVCMWIQFCSHRHILVSTT